MAARVRVTRGSPCSAGSQSRTSPAGPPPNGARSIRDFLKSLGTSHLSATVLLPRREVIVRQVSLPGVAHADIENAIRFQLDTLHPYGDDDVSSGWSALPYGGVLVGNRAAFHRRPVPSAFHRSRHRGLQLHVFSGCGPCRHPPERSFLRRRIRRAEPFRQWGGGSLWRESVAPGLLRRVRSGAGAGHHSGALRIASAARYRAARDWKPCFPSRM